MASISMAENEEQDLRGLRDADLWTTEPTRIDPARQTYERLPPALSTYAMADDQRVISNPLVAAPAVADQPPPSIQLSAEHLNWCSSHYRSYDPTTNTYRSFQGQIRTCQPSLEGSQDPIASKPAAADDAMASTASWCATRYKSYRAQDNTYQPYSGPRVTCTPPTEAQALAANE
jgi:hypothetical protein